MSAGDQALMAMRTVLVSGASSGIGHATAERFALAGDRVFNLDLRPPEHAAADDSAAEWLCADVTDWESTAAAVAHAQGRAGGIDVVVANAGISIRHPVLEITKAEAERVMDVNLLGVLGLWQAAAKVMVRQRSGVLLATASTNGSVGYPFYADYNASKAGVLALCRTFALELSPHVRTACVSPGYVLTPMQRSEYTDEMLAEVNQRIPQARHAAPEEVADAFFFLASPQARFITGQQLVIDGGELAGGVASQFGTVWADGEAAAAGPVR
jgi:3-oxoacyl-[acyl-carrier protein] reductase